MFCIALKGGLYKPSVWPRHSESGRLSVPIELRFPFFLSRSQLVVVVFTIIFIPRFVPWARTKFVWNGSDVCCATNSLFYSTQSGMYVGYCTNWKRIKQTKTAGSFFLVYVFLSFLLLSVCSSVMIITNNKSKCLLLVDSQQQQKKELHNREKSHLFYYHIFISFPFLLFIFLYNKN